MSQRDDAFANTLITAAPAKVREDGENSGLAEKSDGDSSVHSEPAAARDVTSAEKIAGADLVFGGRYEVKGRVGSGGFGVVYEGTDRRLQKRVALKVLTRDRTDDPQLLERFRGEALAAGKLHHPNIAGTTDFEITGDGVAYLVMEYVEGESLDKVIKRDGPLSIRRSARIARGLCRALSAAHGAGIVHRDLKPANIILRREADGSETPKVLDFGLAKLMQRAENASLTDTGQLLGTPIYMSPEQIRGRPDLDGRADIYSVGLILYEMLTAQTPFSSRTAGDVLVAKIVEKPEKPSRYAAIPLSLERLVLKAIDAEPDRRPQTATEFATALEQYTSDTAMSASTMTAVPDSGRRWKFIALGLGAACLLGGALAFATLRSSNDDRPASPTAAPASSEGGDSGERVKRSSGGEESAEAGATEGETPRAGATQAPPIAPAAPSQTPPTTVDAAAAEPPGPSKPAAARRKRKKPADKPPDPGSLYDAPRDRIRNVPR